MRFNTTISGLLAFFGLLCLTASSSSAQLPQTISYQGFLTDEAGDPIEGEMDLTFRLYAVDVGGQAVWTETHSSVSVSRGVFSVELGTINPFDGVSFAQPLWLSAAVGDEVADELAPRTALTAVPYALSLRGLRIDPASDPASSAPNVIGGFRENSVAEGVTGATIAGGGSSGSANSVGGSYGTAGGGRDNEAGGEYATISGGVGNGATDESSTVGGGSNNTAGAKQATVSGGDGNFAIGEEATIGGGFANRAMAWKSTVGGGGSNEALENIDVVGGGGSNTAAGPGATVSGGVSNAARGLHATVGGGAVNHAVARRATVPGGLGNHARGEFSFAAGHFARAIHDGSFVWSDNSLGEADSLLTTDRHQFLIRAAGGVGIGTNDPTSPLTVAGTVESTEGGFRLPDGTVLAGASDLDPSDSGAWETAMNGEAVVTQRKVGIGVPAPLSVGNAGLEIVGRIRVRPGLDVNRSNLLVRPSYSVQDESSTIRLGLVKDTSSTTPIAGLQMETEPDAEGHQGTIHLVTGTHLSSGGVKWGRRITILPSGQVGIGETQPTEQLEVDGNVEADEFLTASDARLKRQVEGLQDALDLVRSLRGVTFHWKDPARAVEGRQIGFIAQDVARVLPEVVRQDDDGIHKVAYAKLVPVLVEALKAQQGQIEALRDELRALVAHPYGVGSESTSASHDTAER